MCVNVVGKAESWFSARATLSCVWDSKGGKVTGVMAGSGMAVHTSWSHGHTTRSAET